MNVLVITPHMDDEALAMGGTIAKHVERGDQITVCMVANRAYDHQYDASDIADEAKAAKQAQEALGYRELRFLNLPDEMLDKSLIEIIKPLEEVYAEVAPDLVYTCHRGDVHQDHQAVFKATMVVCRSIGLHRPARVLCYEVPSSTDQASPFLESQFLPNVYVSISPVHLEKKVQAVSCYERESRTFPHPRAPESIVTRARARGIEVRVDAAEAFVLVREIWA